MALERSPVFVLKSTDSIGIFSTPYSSFVYVMNISNIYRFNDNTGLVATSTVQNAIDNGNLELVQAKDIGAIRTDGSTQMDASYYPVFNQDIATKLYVDDQLDDYLPKDGSVELNTGYTPSNELSIATKEYVDTELLTIDSTELKRFFYGGF